jgi:hypothetical protein
LDSPPLFLKSAWIERDRISLAIRQRRKVWKPFRIVQDAHYPEMIELTLCRRGILWVKADWQATTSVIKYCHLRPTEIIRLNLALKLEHFR